MILGFLFYFLVCFNSNAESYGTYNAARIMGGEPANITDSPYLLALEIPYLAIYLHNCGASIIHRSWALTAAHCIPKLYPKKIRLRAGSSYRLRGGILHYVTEIIIHPKHDPIVHDYDMAVIKVSTPFQYSDVIQKILLASKAPPSGTPALVSGWGKLNHKLEEPEQLQKLAVSIIEYEDCKILNKYKEGFITPQMLCAADPDGGKTVHFGDSGGPLVVDNYQVGIATFVITKSFEYLPSVFVDVSKVRKWIISIIGEESGHQ